MNDEAIKQHWITEHNRVLAKIQTSKENLFRHRTIAEGLETELLVQENLLAYVDEKLRLLGVKIDELDESKPE